MTINVILFSVSEVEKSKQGAYDGPGSKQTKLFGFDYDPSFNDWPYFEVSPVKSK
jgi:hypothetical protein